MKLEATSLGVSRLPPRVGKHRSPRTKGSRLLVLELTAPPEHGMHYILPLHGAIRDLAVNYRVDFDYRFEFHC